MQGLTGVAGQAFFNTTYNSWFDWIVDRWYPRYPDPRYGFMHQEKFMGATVAASYPFGNNTTGTGNAHNMTGSAGRYGELVLECTAASQTANIRTNLAQYLVGSTDLYMEAILRVPTLATVGDDFSFGMGLNDKPSYDANTLCTDGVWATINRSINGQKVIMNTSSNSTRTATNSSGASISAATDFRLSIYINAGNSAQYFLNGVSQGTVSTNLPTGAGRYTGFQIKLDKTAGGAASQLIISHVLVYGYYSAAISG